MAQVAEYEFADLTEEQATSLRLAAADAGLDVKEDDGGFEPQDLGLTALLVIGGAAAIALIVKIWTDLLGDKEGGQVIDCTGETVTFRLDKGLKPYLVAIIAKDGTVTIDVKERTSAFSELFGNLTKVVIDLGKAGVEAIANAVKPTLPAQATVSISKSA